MKRVLAWTSGLLAGLAVAGALILWWVGPCEHCDGSGVEPGTRARRCGLCEGTGW